MYKTKINKPIWAQILPYVKWKARIAQVKQGTHYVIAPLTSSEIQIQEMYAITMNKFGSF